MLTLYGYHVVIKISISQDLLIKDKQRFYYHIMTGKKLDNSMRIKVRQDFFSNFNSTLGELRRKFIPSSYNALATTISCLIYFDIVCHIYSDERSPVLFA